MNAFEAMPIPPIAEKEKIDLKELLRRIHSLKEQSSQYLDEIRDEKLFYSANLRRGSIEAVRSAKEGQSILIPTGSGAIAGKDQSLTTDHLVGCMAVFISGPDKNMLAHLTPSSQLPYKNFTFDDGYESPDRAQTAEKIVQSFGQDRSLTDCRVLIIGNIGDADSKNSKFYYQDLQAIQSDLAKIFSEAGASSVKQVELPLDDTLVYYSPESPDEIHAFGKTATYDKKGSITIDAKSIQQYAIAINPEIPMPFIIHRPAERTEVV